MLTILPQRKQKGKGVGGGGKGGGRGRFFEIYIAQGIKQGAFWKNVCKKFLASFQENFAKNLHSHFLFFLNLKPPSSPGLSPKNCGHA
jgi:hypothetical protein